MADGAGSAGANNMLDSLGTFSPWIKLHIGAPGAVGTANPATETTRQQVTWGSASAGSKSNSVAFSWVNIAGSQTPTDFSAWTASSAGSFGFSGSVTSNPYTAGDTVSVAIGALVTSLTLAS